MAQTPAEAVQRLGSAAASIGGAGSEKALTAAGMAAKTTMVRQARRDLGADATLSGYGRRRNRGRVKVDARFDPEPGLKVVVEPTKRTRGLWALLEEGSKGNQWRAPRRRGAGRRAAGSIGTYTHEPVRPRHTWTKGRPAAARDAFEAYHRNVVSSVYRELRGG